MISKFMENAKEFEMDAVARGGILLASAISEHVENAGSIPGTPLVLPRNAPTSKRCAGSRRQPRESPRRWQSTDFNIQFIAKDNDVKVIECNLRASRACRSFRKS